MVQSCLQKRVGCKKPSQERLCRDLPEGQAVREDLLGQLLQRRFLPEEQRTSEVSLGARTPHHTIADVFGHNLNVTERVRRLTSIDFLLVSLENAPATMGRKGMRVKEG